MPTTKKGRKVALLSGIALVALVGVVVWVYWAKELRIRYLLRPEFEWLGRNAQGYTEYRHRQTGIVFVWLPGGTFGRPLPPV